SHPRSIDTIKAIPFIVSFAPFVDETAELADIVLPDQTYLESWNVRSIPLAEKRVAVSITQPAVKSDLGSRQAADVLLALSRELNSGAKSFESAEDIVRQVLVPLLNPSGATKTDAKETGRNDEEAVDALKTISERGLWVGEVE